MKTAIVSDIHGNLSALTAVLDEVDAQGCERIISLGDVTGYYAEPAACLDLLRERGAVQLLGNHDQYLTSGVDCPRSRLVTKLLEHQRLSVSDEQIEFLSSLSSRFDSGEATFVHGGWQDPVDQYLYQIDPDALPEGFRFYFSGHTHVQSKIPLGGERYYCNPGSVGQPRDGDPRSAFALLGAEGPQLVRIEYDIDKTAHAMRKAGFDEPRLWMNLYEGTQIGGRIDTVALASDTR